MLRAVLDYLGFGAVFVLALVGSIWGLRQLAASPAAPAPGQRAVPRRDLMLMCIVLVLLLVGVSAVLVACIAWSPDRVFASTSGWRWLVEFGPFALLWLLTLRTPAAGSPPAPWQRGGLGDDPGRFAAGVGLALGMLVPPGGGLALLPGGAIRTMGCCAGWRSWSSASSSYSASEGAGASVPAGKMSAQGARASGPRWSRGGFSGVSLPW